MKAFSTIARSLLPAAVVLLAGWAARGADEPAQTPPAVADADIAEQQKADAKAIFAGQCSWCHGDYGMKADKAPRLAGTQMTTPQVEDRIRNGKPGYMPSFRRFLNDGQIALMAKYIKSLNPQE